MEERFAQVLRRLGSRAPGPFHYAELRPDWTGLPIGEKVQSGHAFLDAVRAGQLPGVTDTGEKDGAGRVYHWAGSGAATGDSGQTSGTDSPS
ncbi:DUF1413 domain-containing protein [Maritimibacter alkaliphilus]|uniref:DUF1413 domain-containing protein n=1 Tax=Maritimibacter alkaliphilus TaxID=404236 RepID=UPI001C967C10|nr:DUF1413 domain-containing protein [Maritimibacter alkaliphilus]MBY6091973.1 DUF1413 domain-containing protein [Maritimibacter alkaliphilus]